MCCVDRMKSPPRADIARIELGPAFLQYLYSSANLLGDPPEFRGHDIRHRQQLRGLLTKVVLLPCQCDEQLNYIHSVSLPRIPTIICRKNLITTE